MNAMLPNRFVTYGNKFNRAVIVLSAALSLSASRELEKRRLTRNVSMS
jgi:hypothetical protein